MIKTEKLNAKQAIEKAHAIYADYLAKDMAKCDWTDRKSVHDLNVIDALFDSCIPTMVKLGVLSRRTALYQDSKPFLGKDIGFAKDSLSRDVFYGKMNKIMHHDMTLYFKKLYKEKHNRDLSGGRTLAFVIELLKRQVKSDKAKGLTSEDLKSYNMQCDGMNYAKFLDSYTAPHNALVKEFIGAMTKHFLNTGDIYLKTNKQQGDIPCAVTEFRGDPNGVHYTKTYSHEELLKILESARNSAVYCKNI